MVWIGSVMKLKAQRSARSFTLKEDGINDVELTLKKHEVECRLKASEWQLNSKCWRELKAK